MKFLFLLIIICLALVGASTGYSVGLSKTPVVATFLPLLFGLIAGGSGFVLLNQDFSSEENRKKLFPGLVGISAFSAAYLISMFHATSLRNPSIKPVQNLEVSDQLTLDQTVKFFQLREQLNLLRVPHQEQLNVFSNFNKKLKTEKASNGSAHERCLVLRNYVQALSASLRQRPVSPNEKTFSEEQIIEIELLQDLAFELDSFAQTMSFCESQSVFSERTTDMFIKTVRNEIQSSIDNTFFDRVSISSQDSPWNAIQAFEGAAEHLGVLSATLISEEQKVLDQLDQLANLPSKSEPYNPGRALANTGEAPEIFNFEVPG